MNYNTVSMSKCFRIDSFESVQSQREVKIFPPAIILQLVVYLLWRRFSSLETHFFPVLNPSCIKDSNRYNPSFSFNKILV